MATRSATTRADELAGRARQVLPGGATHVARSYSPPLYVSRAVGSRKWLVDGAELIDYTMGHGALLLGHAHPAVVQAVQEQVARGTHYGAAHPLEVEWAELITGMVASVDEVRFTASGTEAAMLAMRVARVATGRDRVVKLRGHFHGWADALSVDVDATGSAASAPGVSRAVAEQTAVVDLGVPGSLEAALAAGDVAALILEPSGARYGQGTLDPALIRRAREVCDRTGTQLVLDEVVTGFRVAPGGMQGQVGVRPDLTLFGKVMAGGLPGGALGGRRDLMELLAQKIAHPGTFNANPLSAAAGIATLRLVADGAAQRAAEGYARSLESEWRAALDQAGVAGEVRRLSSIVHVQLEDASGQEDLSRRLRQEGIDLLRLSAFCSTAHSLSDLEQSVDAFRRALAAA